MSSSDQKPSTAAAAGDGKKSSGPAIEGGAYEIIRARLIEGAAELGRRAGALNRQRIEVFGGIEMAVLGNERVRTENNCLPRDIVAIGDRLLFGYNVFLGLKKETVVGDVLSLQRFGRTADGFSFEPLPPPEVGFLADPRFLKDFGELYAYYKEARLLQLRCVGQKLLAVFQTSASFKDVRVFRWAVGNDCTLTYLDNRGAEDHIFPAAHDFEWTATGRENFVFGKHPHVNILDQVFVETVGGDLTVKVENNTEDGFGIFREPVLDRDQTLDDAQIHYARLGTLIVLKVLPFREEQYRYLVYNTRTRQVSRIDAIGHSCQQLPEDHGIVFPGGYYLQDGDTKSFDLDASGLQFQRVIRSPNGEDVMFVYRQAIEGRTVLLSYNLIRKEIESPILCNGFCLFPDGTMVVFKAEPEPTRVHQMRIWQTPYMDDEHAAAASAASKHAGTLWIKIGNAELVRGISDCHSLRRMIENQQPSMAVYEDLVKACGRVLDGYRWLGEALVGDLRNVIQEIARNGELCIDEFEKVLAMQQTASAALDEAAQRQQAIFDDIQPDTWQTVDHFVNAMAALRTQRGQLISLRELRYMDLERVAGLEHQVVERFDWLSGRAVEFLLGPDALKPYRDQNQSLMQRIEKVDRGLDVAPLAQELETMATGLDLLTEVVTGLKIEDANARTRILEEISEVFALVNRARATLEGRRRELLQREGVAEFGAQFKLFGQSVQSALGLCDTPEKCDEQLSRLMVQLEELEGRFGEFDQFAADLAQKREEVYTAINGRKQTLLEERQRRAQNLVAAADRILQGVGRRALGFKTLDELNAYFASDAMVLKVRDLAEQLAALGDSVRAEEVVGRLKAARDNSSRQLRDKTELFEEGANVIRLGQHRFAVNTQPLELTMVPTEGRLALQLTGTDYIEPVQDAALDGMRDYWEQLLVSETPAVYRGEYLAACMLFDADVGAAGLSLEQLALAATTESGLLDAVRKYAASRYDEGYDRGVHDADAAAILGKALALYQVAGLLRYAPRARGLACLFWAFVDYRDLKELLQRKARSLGRLRSVFSHSPAHDAFADELATEIGRFLEAEKIPHHADDLRPAGAYLAQELAVELPRFATSAEAVALRDAFWRHLDDAGGRAAFEADLRSLEGDLRTRFELTAAWLQAFVARSDKPAVAALSPVLDEAVVLVLSETRLDRDQSAALSAVEVPGLLGQHPRIENRTLGLRLDEFLTRLTRFRQIRVAGFKAFREARSAVLERVRCDLRLDEFCARVLTSFVRNRLIDQVYLPLIGDNLAKQIGAAGDRKRTDLMGLLLLISPPGYGKTTLMEYVANRLGLVFMKVNGPALGVDVKSFDPGEAPNATARQEVDKINLAFEMGNNVMLYLDDIQHTNPELLQKFISLCDAQRRVEGVWRGRTKTYDLRGKKFCVVMAGNPYTESGARFQIPDMLANRADIYNLGDILGGKEREFALSYLENALTSNAVLQPLASRDLNDFYLLVRMAQGEEIATTELRYGYSAAEIEEIVGVLNKLFYLQQIVLKVNSAYIASASTDERFRTEPPFKLQGSYRNMNKMAAKVVSVMNEQELEQLVDDHYQGEAQTLTSGAEHNLLKLAELRGRLDAGQQQRWEEIKKSFGRLQRSGGAEDDPVVRVTATLANIGEEIERVHTAISDVGRVDEQAASARAQTKLQPLVDGLAALQKSIERAAKAKPSAAPAPAPVALPPSPAIGPEQLNQLLSELGNLRGALMWAAQSSQQGARAFEAQLQKSLAAEMAELRDVIVKSAQSNVRVQANLIGSGNEQTQALLQFVDRLGQTLAALGQQQAAAAGMGMSDLATLLAQQTMLVEGTLVPLVKAIARGVRTDKGTTEKLDQALELLKTIEQKAKTGALKAGYFYVPVGTTTNK
ncbi:MAG: DNA repair ATPase [Deltaproteobacteria bacterium]|nr:DNA repair ATPase [Deltaproteobacteria bacterium]